MNLNRFNKTFRQKNHTQSGKIIGKNPIRVSVGPEVHDINLLRANELEIQKQKRFRGVIKSARLVSKCATLSSFETSTLKTIR